MPEVKNKSKDFVVSTCNAAFYDPSGILICTGTANLNTSIEAAMEELELRAGQGNKLEYTLKYGRTLNVTWQAQDWKLEYIAINTGSAIAEGLTDVYSIDECVALDSSIGTLKYEPIDKVAVKLPNGNIIMVEAEGKTIDLKNNNVSGGTVRATYAFNTQARMLTIDTQTQPLIGKLVLTAEKHNNNEGKVGEIQTIIPKYQASGNFTMEYTPDGALSTNIDGKALAYEGDTCDNGNSVYAYLKEFDYSAQATTVNQIAANYQEVTLKPQETCTLIVYGIKGGVSSNILIDNDKCNFTSDGASYATVGAKTGEIKGVAEGNAVITVDYNGVKDFVHVTVTGE